MESETENPSAELVPAGELVQESPATAPSVLIAAGDPVEEASFALWNWPEGFALDIAHATRTWIQYGMLGFAVVCIVIGAVKGILGL